jgi:uncharacterized protein (DUF433 family)
LPNRGIGRITRDPKVMGPARVSRERVTFVTIVGVLAGEETRGNIPAAHPYLERDDINTALASTVH